METINHIPTNVITGSLGAGKTSIIQALLASKPNQERWAVLVNEFGEVGIDGAMMCNSQNQTVFIKEVPGGCMCCSSSLPMQIALNLLLSQAKPHRLLIEPTGLGHPKEVMETLTQEHYRDVLDIKSTLTLMDARKLHDTRWRNHSTFQEQLQIADTIVLTKSDLYEAPYEEDLNAYVSELGISHIPIVVSSKGDINPNILLPETGFNTPNRTPHHHHSHSAQVLEAPENGVISVRNSGEGFYSRGWICSNDVNFDYERCATLFKSIIVERLKAVMHTNKGIVCFNVTPDGIAEQTLDSAEDSRLEFICDNEESADQIAQIISDTLNLKE